MQTVSYVIFPEYNSYSRRRHQIALHEPIPDNCREKASEKLPHVGRDQHDVPGLRVSCNTVILFVAKMSSYLRKRLASFHHLKGTINVHQLFNRHCPRASQHSDCINAKAARDLTITGNSFFAA